MAAINSAIAVDQSDLVYGEQATVNANATSNATADASSVDGIAAAGANITDNTGLDRSSLIAGTGASVKVDVNGTATSAASTINKVNSATVTIAAGGTPASGTPANDFTGAIVTAGDMYMSATGVEYFVLTSTTAVTEAFQVSLSPGGPAIANTVADALGATELEASTAASMFSGDLAGITDATSTDVDLTIGTAGVVDVDLNALAQATSTNIDGDANAISSTGTSGALGITGTGISAGTTATITADVDADALSVATSVGSPTATAVGGGADANADSDLTAVGINDFGSTTGNITVGTDATIRGAAGSSADRVTVGATASTQTGDATADADAANVAGILDTQSGSNAVANSITVGEAGTVTGLAYTDFDAVAAATTGAATADSTATNISGIQSDTLVIGTDGKVQGQANTQMDVSATVVDGITAGTGDAAATATIAETKGTDLETLTVGDSAVGTSGYNILGRADVDLSVSAASTGADTTTDSAKADGQLTDVGGLEIGDFDATAGSGLTVGTNATVAGVANAVMDASATSVDGEVDATSYVGKDPAAATTPANGESGAVGIDLGDVASIGTNATILGQGAVDLSATATNIGNQGTGNEPTAVANAGADFVAGLNVADATSDVSFGTNASVTAAGTADVDAIASSVTGLNVNASAGNVDTSATNTNSGLVTSQQMDVRGLNSDADITFGTSANVNADAQVDLSATASNTGTLGVNSTVSADAELNSAVGLDMRDGANGAFTVGTTAVVDADSVITGTAIATSVEGTVNADAIATTNIGAQTDAFTVGQSAVVTADADSTQIATAATVGNATGANATADATVTTNIGLDAVGAFTVGTNASVTGIADASNKATATNVDLNATATAGDVASQISGVDTGSTFTVGTNGNLTGQAIVDQDATAATGGLTAGTQSSTAMAQAVEVSGLELDGGATNFGTNATVIGSSAVTNDAKATGIYASTDADVDFTTIQGVELDTGSLVSGTEATVAARATAANVATAQSTSGNADADIDVDLIGGLNATDESVTIGTAGIIDADASITNVATASSVDASGAAVDATINNDRVVGIELASASTTTGVLSTGTTLALDADAVSSQIASASNIGDPLGTDQAATANVASGDYVFGIHDTIITVGTNTTQLTSSATLVGDATASNMSGTSTTQAGGQVGGAGNRGEVFALGRSAATIGLNATNGMSLQASSTLSADASSIEDAATAKAGTGAGYVTPTAAIALALNGDVVTGVDSSPITVGNDAGTILAGATGRLEAIASTNGTTAGDQAATAMAAQTAAGLVDSTVTIGNDGNLTGTANLVGTASASNVGNIGSDNNANSAIQLNSQGIDQTTDTITIGADGNVAGRAFVDGSAISTSVNGSANSQGDFTSLGLNLDDTSDITIGQSGNISGLSVLGEMSALGSFTDQVDLLASTTSNDATAVGDFDSAGILGLDLTTTAGDGTILTAGPTDGDVTGQGLAGVNAVASTIGNPGTTGDNAIADLVGSVSGIQDVDILGGMQGINTVKGTSFGDFDASASSIAGNATAASNTDAYGIFDSNNDGAITLSGNIVAQAVLSNTVMASSVNGNASATATGDAVGMGGYDVTILGSGSFTASANSSSDADASSVKFGARA